MTTQPSVNAERGQWTILTALCVGQSVALMDTTVVNVAIPSMIGGIGATLGQMLWVINSYLLTYAALLVVGGRLGDLFGHKRMYLTGLGVFVTASALCGLAPTPEALIGARVLQGIGAALLTPQSLAIIMRVFPAHRRGRALGIWGAVAGAAAAAGPTLGGVVVATLGWRWVFYLNVPIGLAAMVLSAAALPSAQRRRRSIDLPGTALLTTALFLVTYGLIEGAAQDWGRLWGPVTAPMLVLGGAVLLVAFAAVERGRQDREPLLPFAVLRDRNFVVMAIAVAALPCGLGAMLLLTTIHLQSVLGMGAMSAGLTLAIAPLVSIALAPLAGRWTDRYGGKNVLVAGFLLFAAGIGYLGSVVDSDSTWLVLAPGLAVVGMGMGVVFAPASAIAMGDIDPAMSGAASGVYNTARLSGSVLGGAAVGALLQSRLADTLPEQAAVAATALPAPVRQAFVDSLVARPVNLAAPDRSLLPALDGVPAELVQSLQTTAVHEAIVAAVRTSYLLPATILAGAALLAMAVRRKEAPWTSASSTSPTTAPAATATGSSSTAPGSPTNTASPASGCRNGISTDSEAATPTRR